jgi:drug/metabolite transporter (DMT)-like permease
MVEYGPQARCLTWGDKMSGSKQINSFTAMEFQNNATTSDLVLPWIPRWRVPAPSGFVLGSLANILWGTSFYASRTVLLVWPPLTATLFRFLLALGALGVSYKVLKIKLSVPKDTQIQIKVGMVGLLGFTLLYPFQLYGLKFIDTGLSACLMLTSPVFVLIMATIILKEPLSGKKLGGTLLGILGGIALIRGSISNSATPNSHSGHELILGIALTLVASISLAASVIATRTLRSKVDTANLTFWSMLIGTIALIPFCGNETIQTISSVSAADILKSMVPLCYLALICSACCFFLWNKAIAIAPARDLAITMHLKTPVAIGIGVYLGHEILPFSAFIGTALLSIGVFISQIYGSSTARPLQNAVK